MRLVRLSCFLVLTIAAASPAPAQGSQADYQRAAALPARFRGKVVRDRVTPHWLTPDSFWYTLELGGGKRESWLVDAKAGVKTAYQPQAAAPDGGLTPLNPQGVRSRDGGGETEVLFQNQTKGPVQVFWLSTDGTRQDYGTIPAGQEKRQHTFAGHAWLITADGRPLVAFVAGELAGKAVITGTTPAPMRQGNGGGNGRRGPAASPRGGISPDGKWQVSVRDNNLFLKDANGGAETQLTKDGSEADYYSGGDLFWSPDSKRLVALRTKRGQEHKVYYVESSPPDQVQPKLHTLDYLKPGDEIPQPKPHLFDMEKHAEIPVSDVLFPNPWSLDDVRWEPDSSRFTFLYNQRGHQTLRIVSVDAASGEARPIVDEQSPTFIDYAGKFFVRYLPETHEILWMSERSGWCHLYLYDSKTGAVKNPITTGDWVVRGVDRVDPEKRQVWFRASGVNPKQDPYYIQFGRVNFDGTGLTWLTDGDGTHSVEYSPDGRYLIDTYSRVDMAPVTELRRVDTGARVLDLERGDFSAASAAGWATPERFASKARDGKTDIYGVIFRPTNFDPAKKYPVIEDIYAGPQSSFVPKAFQAYHSQQGLAELGFIVVKIDGMGTSNRSKAFHDVCWKNLVDAGLPDRILWIKAAGAKYPYMDLDRVGIFGTSAGGQNSLGAMLTHPEFYKACVSACGCHDNRMDKIWWNELWMGWPVGPHYAEQSNVTLAKNLQGKLLLIVGEDDTNVDPATTLQVCNALIKANKDYEFLMVPGAGHGMGGAYGARRMQDFFVRNLLGVEPRR